MDYIVHLETSFRGIQMYFFNNKQEMFDYIYFFNDYTSINVHKHIPVSLNYQSMEEIVSLFYTLLEDELTTLNVTIEHNKAPIKNPETYSENKVIENTTKSSIEPSKQTSNAFDNFLNLEPNSDYEGLQKIFILPILYRILCDKCYRQAVLDYKIDYDIQKLDADINPYFEEFEPDEYINLNLRCIDPNQYKYLEVIRNTLDSHLMNGSNFELSYCKLLVDTILTNDPDKLKEFQKKFMLITDKNQLEIQNKLLLSDLRQIQKIVEPKLNLDVVPPVKYILNKNMLILSFDQKGLRTEAIRFIKKPLKTVDLLQNHIDCRVIIFMTYVCIEMLVDLFSYIFNQKNINLFIYKALNLLHKNVDLLDLEKYEQKENLKFSSTETNNSIFEKLNSYLFNLYVQCFECAIYNNNQRRQTVEKPKRTRKNKGASEIENLRSSLCTTLATKFYRPDLNREFFIPDYLYLENSCEKYQNLISLTFNTLFHETIFEIIENFIVEKESLDLYANSFGKEYIKKNKKKEKLYQKALSKASLAPLTGQDLTKISLNLDMSKIKVKIKESENVQTVITALREEEDLKQKGEVEVSLQSKITSKQEAKPEQEKGKKKKATSKAATSQEAPASLPFDGKLDHKAINLIETISVQSAEVMDLREFFGICVSHKFMSGNAAIETLNDFTYEEYDEPLFEASEEENVVYITTEILKDLMKKIKQA